MITIVSTRFTDQTWEQNMTYRKKHNITGSIYGVSQELSPKIEYDSIVFAESSKLTTYSGTIKVS